MPTVGAGFETRPCTEYCVITMPQAYAASPTPSTDSVPARRWRLALALFLIVIVSGAVLALVLAHGLADPPRAGTLVWETESLDEWERVKDRDGNLYRAPVTNRAPPFTVEIKAAVLNDEPLTWGLWLETRDGEYRFLVGYGGYVSAGATLDWRNFIHLQPETNRLCLHVEADGFTTFRVNQEIAWQGHLDLPDAPSWGLASLADTRLELRAARLYAP